MFRRSGSHLMIFVRVAVLSRTDALRNVRCHYDVGSFSCTSYVLEGCICRWLWRTMTKFSLSDASCCSRMFLAPRPLECPLFVFFFTVGVARLSVTGLSAAMWGCLLHCAPAAALSVDLPESQRSRTHCKGTSTQKCVHATKTITSE